MSGMDAVYNHITPDMRQHLCDVLENLWYEALKQRYKLAATSSVPILDQLLAAASWGGPARRKSN